jgi:hypothetical protein
VKYLCLLSAERVMEQMTPSERDAHFEEYREFMEEIRQSGHYVSCNRLKPPSESSTLRVRGGQMLITDGPFVETKEQLGGYFLIEARDMNEALQIAARIPCARTGFVEVRPVAEDDQTVTTLGLERPAAVLH